jgi:hypothetical protein
MASPFYRNAHYSAAMPSRLLAVPGVLLLGALLPASASAAVIDPLKPCYVTAGTAAQPQAEGVAIVANGFTPNSKVDLTMDGRPVPNGIGLQADPAGILNLTPTPVPAPFIAEGSREFSVTLTEQGNPANTATATARTTALSVSVRPEQAPPSKRIRFKGAGFTDDKGVYAHYLYKGKVRRTVRMARRTGTCGTWRKRARQIPVDEPRTGLWTVQFDQRKRYVKPTQTFAGVYVRLRISVTLRPQG